MLLYHLPFTSASSHKPRNTWISTHARLCTWCVAAGQWKPRDLSDCSLPRAAHDRLLWRRSVAAGKRLLITHLPSHFCRSIFSNFVFYLRPWNAIISSFPFDLLVPPLAYCSNSRGRCNVILTSSSYPQILRRSFRTASSLIKHKPLRWGDIMWLLGWVRVVFILVGVFFVVFFKNNL